MHSNTNETFASIVGSDNVFTPASDGFHERYADPFFFSDEHNVTPPGAVLPANTAEVQAIVRAANELKVGLWVISRGRNLGYGGAAPRRSGDWVLDLGRMNRVLEINEDLAYAVVEPGVSFFQFTEELQASGKALIPSVPDLGYGSLIGNALERGFGYAAHGEHSRFLCGFEVVLPDGSLMRTGMGADEDSPARFVYKGGFGPDSLTLFQQSNLGIVTQAAVWLLPRPETIAACLITVPEVGDLSALVDAVRPLHLNGTIDSPVIMGNTLAIASGIMPRSAISTSEGPLPLEAIRGVAEKFGLGFWNAQFGIYGDDEIVRAKVAQIEKKLAISLPICTIRVAYYPGDIAPNEVPPQHRAQLGVASGDLMQMAAWRGGSPAHTDFSVVTPADGRHAQQMVDIIRARVESYGLDHVGGMTLFGRHAIMINLLAFDAENPTDREQVKNLFTELIDDSVAAGFAPYRAHPAFMDKIAEAFNFNDQAQLRFNNTLKDALDPNRILSVGKQGVWGNATTQ